MSKKITSKYSVVNSGALYDLAAELESQKEKLNQQHSGSGAIKGLKRDDSKVRSSPIPTASHHATLESTAC